MWLSDDVVAMLGEMKSATGISKAKLVEFAIRHYRGNVADGGFYPCPGGNGPETPQIAAR